MSDLYLALIHFPVTDRRGQIVTSAITSLDVHDLARSARTYGVRATFVVHPIEEQRAFAHRLRDHWLAGYGRKFDSRREEALAAVEIVTDLDQAIARVEQLSGVRPLLVHTSARNQGGMSHAQARERITAPGPPYIILIGTGFGMAPELAERVDIKLAPIRGPGDYNHLSVRAAASIILDRLRGC